jgi:nicotinamide riboside kinase
VKIALLGAESTGKTTLAQALADALRARGHRAAVVPEVLRAWCTEAGRAPRAEEQMAIAQEQERRVDAAAADRAGLVIADTTALMVPIYGALLDDDDPVYRFALERQRGYDLTLVTGLDLPWVDDGLRRAGHAARGPVDARLRSALGRAGVSFRVVYGRGEERTRNALAPLLALLGERPAEPGPRWTWSCEKCSDPDCEHRLFTRLRDPAGRA